MSSQSSGFFRFVFLALLIMGALAVTVGPFGNPVKRSFVGRKLIEAFTNDVSPSANAQSRARAGAKAVAPAALKKDVMLHGVSKEDQRKLDSLIEENAD